MKFEKFARLDLKIFSMNKKLANMKVIGFVILATIVLTASIAGCAFPAKKHPNVNMTQILKKYESIHDMGGVATINTNGTKSSVIFVFIKPDRYAEWSSTTGTVVLFNGSVKTIHNGKTVKHVKSTFNPYDYGRILKNGKISYANGKILVENKEGSVWLNYDLLPVEIQWNNGIKIVLKKLYINKGWGKDLFTMYSNNRKPSKPNRLITISQAQEKVNFSIITPKYTSTCNFIGALVFNINNSKAVVLYYATPSGSKTLTITESKGKIGGISKTLPVYISGKRVLKGVAFGNMTGYMFKVGNTNVTVYGSLSNQELIGVVKSMLS